MQETNTSPSSTEVTQPLIKITPSAANKIYELMTEEKNLTLKLRVYVIGGGCSGFQYGVGFEEIANEDDIIIEQSIEPIYTIAAPEIDSINSLNTTAGNQQIVHSEDMLKDTATNQADLNNNKTPTPTIQVLIDLMSMQYLKGAEVDYRKDIHGEQFIIRNNPNAKTVCGCGSSFSSDN